MSAELNALVGKKVWLFAHPDRGNKGTLINGPTPTSFYLMSDNGITGFSESHVNSIERTKGKTIILINAKKGTA